MCFISLAFRHNVEMRCVQSTRQCCNTEGSILPEVRVARPARAAWHTVRSACAVKTAVWLFGNWTVYLVCKPSVALRVIEVRIRTSKKDDAGERVAALRSAPHIRQLGRAERKLVGFGNVERPV